MEYVEGETLAKVLAKLKDVESEADTPFGKKDDTRYFANLAEAFADVADGLQHAHSNCVVHRDIKPSNLILDTEGRLRILDFGLARLEGQESLTISGDVVGTPLYMSPEQARRRKVPIDHRTDVYSLGATMYEALCGRPPFKGRDHQDTMSQIIERDPVELDRVNPRVPKDLGTIVLKCLQKEVGERFATAEELELDLRRFVRGDPIAAKPQGRWAILRQRLARKRRLIVSRAVLALAVLVCGILSYEVYFSQEDEWRFVDIQLVHAASSPYMESTPTPAADDCELWHKHNPGGIWLATRSSRESPFSSPRRLVSPVNSYDWNGQIDVSPRWPAPGAVAYFLRGHFRPDKDFNIYRTTWRAVPLEGPDPLRAGEETDGGTGNVKQRRN